MDTIKIGNYNVSKDDIGLYVQHFEKDKSDVFNWDNKRVELHNRIFKNIGIERFSNEGYEFGEEFDKFCEPRIMKHDAISALTKKLCRTKTETEIKYAQYKLQSELYKKQKAMELGLFKEPKKDSKCRRCGINLIHGIARINDHLAIVEGYDEVDNPICDKCGKEDPDDHVIAFKKQYWNKYL